MDSGEVKSLIDSKFDELDVKAQCDLWTSPRKPEGQKSLSGQV